MATYYVSKGNTNGFSTGHDTNNNGLSMAAPFLTISRAIVVGVDGDTIYVNDGTYTGTELGAASVISVPSTKSLKIYPWTPYGVTIQTTAASAQIVSLTGTANYDTVFGKFIIDGEIPGAPGTYQPTGVVLPNPSGQNVIILDGTKIQNCGTQNILNSKRRGTLIFNDVIFAGLMAQGVASTSSGADVAPMTVEINGLNCDNVTTSVNTLTRVLDFTRLSTSTFDFSFYATRLTGSVTAPGALGSSAAIAWLVLTGIGRAVNRAGVNRPVVVEDCNFSYTCASTGATCYGIYIKNASRGAAAKANEPVIRRNTIAGNAPSTYVISAGDTTTAYDVDDARVYFNVITVPYFASATPHCIALGNVTRGKVIGNRCNGGYVGILAGINQGGIIAGNLSVGCYGMALYCKGSGATTAPLFVNNTVVLTNTLGAARGGGLGVAVQGATNNAAVTFRNNLVYAYTDLYRYVDVGTSQVATFEGNNYYSAGPAGFTSPWSYQSSTYTTFAAWVAARESDAYNLDPKMIDAANGDYRLRYDSALRGAAKHAENFARSYRGRSTKTRHLGIGAYVTNSLITAGTRGMDQWA